MPRITLSFVKARALARRVGFKSRDDYNARYKQHGLPSSPRRYPEFTSWAEYLGISPRGPARKFVSYARAKTLVREFGITNQLEYNILRRSNPEIGLPWVPHVVYRAEFEGWGIFTGSNNLNNEQRQALKVRVGEQ